MPNINKAKRVVMQPKYASTTIKPDKGKGSYNRHDQMDWVYEYEVSEHDRGWISHANGGRQTANE